MYNTIIMKSRQRELFRPPNGTYAPFSRGSDGILFVSRSREPGLGEEKVRIAAGGGCGPLVLLADRRPPVLCLFAKPQDIRLDQEILVLNPICCGCRDPRPGRHGFA